MTTKRKTINYVNNKDFMEALIQYKKDCADAEEKGIELPIVPNYIGNCVNKIATRLSMKWNFSGYSYREEMVGDGVENAIRAINNFNPEKSTNPFAYFTQIIWYAFLRRIEYENKQTYIKHKVTEIAVVSDTIVEGGGTAEYVDLSTDYMNDFVTTYENKMKRKRDAKNIKLGKKSENSLENIMEDKNDTDKTNPAS